MIVALCLVLLASAAPPEAYPLRSDLSLSPEGVTRVALPAELVGVDPQALGRTLRVQNADGVEVPFAALLSTTIPDPTRVSLSMRPVGPTAWVIDAAERPVDLIRFDLAGVSAWPGVWVTLEADGWSSGPRFLYDGDIDGAPFSMTSVDVPHLRGPFRVELATADGGPERIWDLDGYVHAPDYTPPRTEIVPAEAPVSTETGSTRWTVRLPGPRAITALTVEVDGDVFKRTVRVGVPNAGTAPYLNDVGTIRRLQVGEARIDQNRVELSLQGDTLLVDIDSDRGVPLPVTRFVVESVGAEIVVRDPGPGPHALLGGTYDEDMAHDLGYAAVELLRGETLALAAPPPTPNPGYVPLPTREGLDGVGPTLNLARFRFSRPIEGTGWARILLDATVLGHARSDLADVRVVDAQGRVVPHLLRALGTEAPVPVGETVRVENGHHSEIRVPLPTDGAPVATLTLHTPQGRFARTVSVLRDRGRMTEPVRVLDWRSEAIGSTLSVSLFDHFGRELLIDIDNGDNPPLPVDAITVTTPVWEVRAHLPEGGARLVYGAPGEAAPTWDLQLLEAEVWRMPLSDATLGAEVAETGPSLSAVERAVVVAAIGLLAVGLVGMTIRALRTPDPEPAA